MYLIIVSVQINELHGHVTNEHVTLIQIFEVVSARAREGAGTGDSAVFTLQCS